MPQIPCVACLQSQVGGGVGEHPTRKHGCRRLRAREPVGLLPAHPRHGAAWPSSVLTVANNSTQISPVGSDAIHSRVRSDWPKRPQARCSAGSSSTRTCRRASGISSTSGVWAKCNTSTISPATASIRSAPVSPTTDAAFSPIDCCLATDVVCVPDCWVHDGKCHGCHPELKKVCTPP